LPLGAAGASFAAVADAFEAALHMVLIGAVLAGAAWTVLARSTRHTRSDQWSARALMCAAGVTVLLGGMRAAFGLDASLTAVVAAAVCLLASVGALATVHTHREGASFAAVAVGSSATGALVVAACVLAARSAEPVLALPVFLLLAVAVIALTAMGDPNGPVELSPAASAVSGVVSIGTLGVVLTESYDLTSYFGAAVLSLAVSRVFPAPLRSALRWGAALTGTAVFGWCAAVALSVLAVAFGAAPIWLLTWEIPAVAAACALGLPLVPKGLRLDFLAAIASVAVLAAGGLWAHPWAPAASFVLVAAAALTVALASGGRIRRCVGWVGAYAWLMTAALAAHHQSAGGGEPALVAFGAVAAGSALLVVAFTAPLGEGPAGPAARAGAHLFIGVNLLWTLMAAGDGGERISVYAPLGFTAYAAALAAAAWAAPARRVAHVFASFGAVTAAHVLLAARGGVSGLEYYTVPPSVLLLGIGLWLLRRGPDMGSWTALAPALAIGLGPSLALSFGPDGDPLRRLLVGAVALAVLLVAAWRRWQAPLVIGAVVLAALSVNEMVLLWSLVPKWIPLAVGGVVLIAAGATLEQRRRDLARLSGSVKAMR
ncbi:SCO7613 C-terminal domain-containing membrane protein, partial [Glycomyces tenuis]